MFHVDRVGMASDIVSRLEHGELMIPVKEIGRDHSGDACADNRDLHTIFSASLIGSGPDRNIGRHNIDARYDSLALAVELQLIPSQAGLSTHSDRLIPFFPGTH